MEKLPPRLVPLVYTTPPEPVLSMEEMLELPSLPAYNHLDAAPPVFVGVSEGVGVGVEVGAPLATT